MNALVMRLEERADQAAAAGENDLAALLWEAAAAVALQPSRPEAVAERRASVPIVWDHEWRRAIGRVHATADGRLIVDLSEEVNVDPNSACALFGDAGIRAIETELEGSKLCLRRGEILEFSFPRTAARSRASTEVELKKVRELALRRIMELPTFAWATLDCIGAEPQYRITLTRKDAIAWAELGLEVLSLVRRSEVERIMRRM